MKLKTINDFLRIFGLVLVVTIDASEKQPTPTYLRLRRYQSYMKNLRKIV